MVLLASFAFHSAMDACCHCNGNAPGCVGKFAMADVWYVRIMTMIDCIPYHFCPRQWFASNIKQTILPSETMLATTANGTLIMMLPVSRACSWLGLSVARVVCTHKVLFCHRLGCPNEGNMHGGTCAINLYSCTGMFLFVYCWVPNMYCRYSFAHMLILLFNCNSSEWGLLPVQFSCISVEPEPFLFY